MSAHLALAVHSAVGADAGLQLRNRHPVQQHHGLLPRPTPAFLARVAHSDGSHVGGFQLRDHNLAQQRH
eukprot:4274302-Pyramimonas_sp.AAC.1